MVTPTLFDMASITGLRPTWETFNPTFMTKTKPKFSFTLPNYSNFIKYYYEDHHEEVSDHEDIVFLTFLLSHFVFYSNSLQVAKKFIPLKPKSMGGITSTLENWF